MRRTIRFSLPLLLLLAAAATDPDTARRQLRAAEHDRAVQTKAANDAINKARQAESEARRLAARSADLAGRLHATGQAVTDSAAKLDQLRRQAEEMAARLRRDSADFAPVLPLIERLSLFPVETLLAAPAPPRDALRGLMILHGLARNLGAQAAALRRRGADLARLRQAEEAEAAALAARQLALQNETEDLNQQADATRAAQQHARHEAALAARRAAQAAARAADLRGALATLNAERKRRDDATQAAASTATLPAAPPASPAGSGTEGVFAAASGRFTAPVAGPVSTHWGQSTDAGPATGITYKAAAHARVVSACGGRVVFAGPFRSYGQLVIVDCGGGYHLVLAGLDHLETELGRAVREGQAVGSLGDSANLYVELRQGDRPVDPAPYLRRAGR